MTREGRDTKIGVLGAGAIGGYVGGALAGAGVDVVFVGRPGRGPTWFRNGLQLTDLHGRNQVVPASAIKYSDRAEALSGVDLVLLTVKSGDTANAARDLSRVVRSGATILSLQNGLSNAVVLRDQVPQATVLRGMVPFNVTSPRSARLHCGTEGQLAVEAAPATVEAAPLFAAASLPLQLRHDMEAVQWAKLLMNLNNSINALSGLPLREQLNSRGYRVCLALAQEEAMRLLAEEGRVRPARLTPVPPKLTPLLLRLPDVLFQLLAGRTLKVDGTARSSMADDLRAGRAPEVDWINGEVVALAKRLGRQAPVNERLVALVKDAQKGKSAWTARSLLKELSRRPAAG